MPDLDAFSMCNACDSPIATPNPMGYCDKCLAESKAETEKVLAKEQPYLVPLSMPGQQPQVVTETPSTIGPVTIGSSEWYAMVKAEKDKEAREKADRSPREWAVYYMPNKKPGTLSYHAERLTRDAEGNGHSTAGMAWALLLAPIVAISDRDAIQKTRERITAKATEKGKTYADMCELLARKY